MNIDIRKNVSFYHYIKSYLNYVVHDIKFVNGIRKRFKNSLSISVKIIQNKYPIDARLKEGNLVTFTSFNHIYCHLLNLNYDIVEGTVVLNDIIFYNGMENAENLYDTFVKEEYDFLNVKNKIVIDVGANIADTSIYFKKKGALKVIAIEPNKICIDIAMKNLLTNKMDKDIDLLFLGCGNERTIHNGQEIKISSLQSIMARYSYKPEILKLDCEGCEYETILNSPIELLSKFSQIQIEYHYGYKNLKTKLEESGFLVHVTEPRYFRIRPRSKDESTKLNFYDELNRKENVFELGWIYADNIRKFK